MKVENLDIATPSSVQTNPEIIGANTGVIANGVSNENGLMMTFTPSKRKTIKKIKVTIEGNFSIVTANEAHANINNEIDAYEQIDLTIKNLHQFDLPAVQLLYFLKNKLTQTNKNLTIDSELASDDRTLMQNAGLLDVLTKAKLTEND